MNLVNFFEDMPTMTIKTLAGVGYKDEIPAKEADVGWPMGTVRRPDGDLVVADYQGNRIWRIDQHGILHTLTGDGVPGDSGDGGPAIEARVYNPHDLTIDSEGNLYFSDLGNQTYRRIDHKTDVITKVAGSGKVGRGGDGGPATEAELDTTCGIAVDDKGNIYISSEWTNNIRRIDSTTGKIELFAGLDARHYTSESDGSRPFSGAKLSLGGYHGDGGPASKAGFYHPEHLAFDSKGNLFVCDNSNNRIRKIDAKTGIISTVLGTGQPASNGDGGPATEASTLMPDAICLDVYDNLYIGEKYGFRIRRVDAETGIVTTLVGTGVPGFGEEGLHGSETQVNSCEAGIWADPDGTVFWGDCSGRLRRYDGVTGIVTTVLGGTTIHDGEIATSAFLNGPGGICTGPKGDVYIADRFNQRIRMIDSNTGIINSVAGNGARAYGGDGSQANEAFLGNPNDVSVDSRGRIVIADTRHGHVRRVDEDGVIRNIAGAAFQWDKGDDGPAISANLINVISVSHGPNNDIYLGDAGAGRIRKVDSDTGVITTVAGIGLPGYTGDQGPATEARTGAPSAIRFDEAGNLYFADKDYHVVRKVDTEGTIATIIGTGERGYSQDGTPPSKAMLDTPSGLEISSNGTIFVSDSRNNRVRMIGPDGILRTIAGGYTAGYNGDCSPSSKASLNEPHGLCLYRDDVLLISDFYNNRVRVVKLGPLS